MEVVWIRHGEPERIAPGSGVAADPQLTAAGREQAKRLADWLAFEPIDAVLTSPLRRAVETAAPIAAALGLEAETFEGIVEYDRDSDHYIPTEELRLTKDDRWTAMVEGRWDEFGAELPEIFRARVDEAVAAIVERFPGGRVAAVCHGGVINVALGSVLGVERPLWFEPGYTSMSRMLASRGGIKSVASLNELAHLQATRRDPEA
jgi:2,3-bisphosphoglycerate-dependent phosphoglycerate mutase